MLPDSLAVFTLDDQPFALAVTCLKRIVPAVQIAPLPGAPRGVRGVINVQGEIVPVFDLRARFGWAERELRLADHLVIADTGRRRVALIVDSAIGVVRPGESQVVPAEKILPEFHGVEGVMKLDDDIVFIHDLDRFLSLEDEHELAAAMSADADAR